MTTKDTIIERAVGRRKTSAARVRIMPGKGNVTVNGREFKEYFPVVVWQNEVIAPLLSVGKEKDLDVTVKIAGGGVHSQAGAVRHGIARALLAWNEEFRPILKAEGFLTRDPRAKERKHFGHKKARRGHQWRKR